MTNQTITVNPVTPHIGALVSGVDITSPLSNLEVDTLHRALADHQVLFFRNQPFTLDSQKAFGRLFGELHFHPNIAGPEGHPENPADSCRRQLEAYQRRALASDVSCDPEPPMGSVLHLRTVPPVGGDTLFASMYAAYETLSPRMKTYLEGLTAFHSGERSYRRTNALLNVDDRGRVFPSANHPVVRTHRSPSARRCS